MKLSPRTGLAEGMKTWLETAVFDILENQEWLVKEYLLCLLQLDSVFLILASISCIPFESFDGRKIQHRILS
jgi:hypothetical protein